MPWIYRYLRADLEEIDQGPFESEQICKETSDKHASFGAITTPPIEVDEEYKFYGGEEKRVVIKDLPMVTNI